MQDLLEYSEGWNERLQEWRESQEWTKQELAAQMRVTWQQIHELEKGQVKPNPETLKILGFVLRGEELPSGQEERLQRLEAKVQSLEAQLKRVEDLLFQILESQEKAQET